MIHECMWWNKVDLKLFDLFERSVPDSLWPLSTKPTLEFFVARNKVTGEEFTVAWLGDESSHAQGWLNSHATKEKSVNTSPASSMPKNHVAIDDDVKDVIKRSEIGPDYLKLPPQQLDPKLYGKVKKVLELASGKWTTNRQAFVFTKDPRETLAAALDNGAILHVKRATQAFYTPQPLANTLMIHASVEGQRVLEPSAGHGMLADTAKAHGAELVQCYEVDPDSAQILQRKGYDVMRCDFLSITPPVPTYDRVVMNPPFTGNQDIKHVRHAYDAFLKTPGVLVAIMSPGWETGTKKIQVEFRAWLKGKGTIVERFSAGQFKQSGTNVATVMVKIFKFK